MPALASRPGAGERLGPAVGPAAVGLAEAAVEQQAVHYKAHPRQTPPIHQSPMSPAQALPRPAACSLSEPPPLAAAAAYTATRAYHPSTKTEYH